MSEISNSSLCCRFFVIQKYSFNEDGFNKYLGDKYRGMEVANLVRPSHRVFHKSGEVGQYFTCTKFVNDKCQIYENRPDMCRDYTFKKGKQCPHEEVYGECSTKSVCNGCIDVGISILEDKKENLYDNIRSDTCDDAKLLHETELSESLPSI